jgi:hypothetical protein
MVISPSHHVTQPGEAVLTNVSLKLIQLHQQIRFTNPTTTVLNAP